jgi:integration host factor subunit alpha
MSMTKCEIIESIFEKTGLTNKECVNAVESTFDIIKSELEKGNSVNVSGFGKWTVKSKRARNGRNPQTGDSMIIDARMVVTFKPSLVLKDALNAN